MSKIEFFSAEDNYKRTDIFLYDKKTHAFARGRLGKSDGHLLDGAASQCVPLPLSWKQPQLLLLILAQAVAVADAKYVKIGRQQGDKMVREWRVKKIGHWEIKERKRERGKCTWDAGGHGWCCDEDWGINIKRSFWCTKMVFKLLWLCKDIWFGFLRDFHHTS